MYFKLQVLAELSLHIEANVFCVINIVFEVISSENV